MKIEGYDFCLEEQFRHAIHSKKPVSFELASPDILKSLEGKKVIALRLKNIIDRDCAPDGTIIYLEIETE